MASFDSEIRRLIAAALAEDIGTGDVTSQLLIPETAQATMQFVAREEMVACGLFLPALVYAELDKHVKVESRAEEGVKVAKGTVLAVARGTARGILTGERVALNLLQRTCGVATLTRAYVDAVKGTKTVILDTRKTMPGMRALDKYAVKTGGGQNYRMGLFDMVLIKDNHIALCGGITGAVQKARQGTKLPVVVECDTLAQVKEALSAKPDRILLDNMSPEMLRQAVALAAGYIPLEASGGVSLKNVKAIAETGVNFISIGALTHSAIAVDIGGDVILES